MAIFFYTQLPLNHHVIGTASGNQQRLEDSYFVSRADGDTIRHETHSVRSATSTSNNSSSADRYNVHCAIPDSDSDLPTCPFCNAANFDAVTVYLEEFS